ncbi:hypothetical protein Hanom_Chr06g00506391 [Helianthus anomalus]
MLNSSIPPLNEDSIDELLSTLTTPERLKDLSIYSEFRMILAFGTENIMFSPVPLHIWN